MQAAARATVCYWAALCQWVFTDKEYSDVSFFKGDLHAQVQVYSLSLIFSLWSQKHYRCKSFQQDMLEVNRNMWTKEELLGCLNFRRQQMVGYHVS